MFKYFFLVPFESWNIGAVKITKFFIKRYLEAHFTGARTPQRLRVIGFCWCFVWVWWRKQTKNHSGECFSEKFSSQRKLWDSFRLSTKSFIFIFIFISFHRFLRKFAWTGRWWDDEDVKEDEEVKWFMCSKIAIQLVLSSISCLLNTLNDKWNF